MEKQYNLEDVISKVHEIRGFLRSGDEILPFLGDLLQFLRDMMPLIQEAGVSLKEGTSNLPTASNRISDVTQTTELATQEILDKLDAISEKLSRLGKTVDSAANQQIEVIQNDVTDIIYALQFQDITSQKLEHANRILAAIYEKFISIFTSMNLVRTSSHLGSKVIEELQDGIQDKLTGRETTEFHEKIQDTVRDHEISQDDIDQLFS